MRNGITSRLASRRSSAQRFMVRVFTLLTLMVSLIPRSSQATVIDWSSTASTTAWATGSNWVGNTAPANSLVTDIARFDKTSYLNQPNSGTTSINGIQIGDGTTATAVLTLTNTALSIGGSGITMFANAGAATLTGGSVKIGANQSWSNNSSNLLTVSSNITNNGNTTPFTLTLNGSGSGGTTIGGVISNGGPNGTTALTVNTTGGVTTLSGINTYTGGTTLTLGTLKLSGSGALGSTSGALTVNGGTLDLNGTSQDVGNFTGSGGTILNNSTGTNVTLTIGNNNGTGGNYSGVIADHTSGTGTVALTKTGTGTITLSGANTYTGGTTFNAGTISISSDANLGASSGGLTFNGGTLQATQSFTSSRAITMTGSGTFNVGLNNALEETGAISGNGVFNLTGFGTLILSGSGSNGSGSTTLSGTLSLRGTVSLGSGLLTMTTSVLELGNGDFTRALGIGAGQVNMSGSFGAGFAAYGADRIVNLGGSGATVTWGSGNFLATGEVLYIGSVTADHTVDFQNGINLNAATRTIETVRGVGTTPEGKISGVISGAAGLTQDLVTGYAPGTLILSGANTYTGTTTVSAGTLNIQNNTGLGTTAAGTTVSSGATLQLQNNITAGAEALTISGTGASGQNGALVNVSGTNNYGGLLTLGAATTISSDSGTLNLTNTGTITGATFGLTLTGSGNGSISSIIGTTSGTLTKSGTGSWTLSGANTYTGGTTINAGTLVVNSASSLGATSGGATINAGTLEVATGYSASRIFTLGDAASTFQIDPSQTFTVTSAIGGTGTLNKTGTGTMVLSGANTYSGGTTISAGTLNLGSSGALNSSGTISFGGGTLQYSASNTTDYSNRFSTATNQAYSIDTNSQSVTFATALTSSGGTLTKLGSGTLTLSGVNTYTGGTTINAGTLQLGNANTSSGGALGTTTGASVTFGAGSTGKLQLNGNATTIIDLNTNATVGTPIIENGSSTATAVLTVNTANTDTYAGLLQDGSSKSLGLTKSGSGTLILTGLTNSQTGITNINGGILRASDITTYAAGNQNITSSILGQAAFNGVSFNGNNATLQLRYNGQSDSTSQTLTLPTTKGGALLVNASAPNATIDVDRQSGSGTNKTIAFTSSTIASSSTLNVTGADGYSLGLGNLIVGSGGSAGNVTVNPTTANLTIGTATSSGTTSNHTLILDGTSSGNTVTGAMANGGVSSVLSVTKQNTSSWTLSGASTYTGATTVSGGILSVDNNNATSARLAGTTLVTVNAGGTLLLSQSGGTGSTDRINNSATMTLNGGTFNTGGLSEHGASNNTAGIGALTLQSTSIIDMGNVASIVAFANSNLSIWAGTLNIYNWSGTPQTGGGTDQLYFGSDTTGLTAAQLLNIQFYSGNGTGAYGAGALILANGEVAPVPEPSTYIVGILALSVIGYHRHRRRLHLMRRQSGEGQSSVPL